MAKKIIDGSLEISGNLQIDSLDVGGIASFNDDIECNKHAEFSTTTFTSDAQFNSNVKIDGTVEASSFLASSDRNLKENIVEYEYKNSILELPVMEYNFINDPEKEKQIGCIAQDLQKLYPELVEQKENGYLAIKENKLVYLLLEEIKILKKEVIELKEKIME